MRAAILFALAIVAPGCSALGLDHIPIPVCRHSSDCQVLNTAAHIADDACTRYFCSQPDSGHGACMLGPADEDGDGVPRCGIAMVDCDDANASIAPGKPELPCTGLDENCDGVIDETGFAEAPIVAVTALADAQTISFAPGESGESAIAWTTRASTAQVATLGASAMGGSTMLAYQRNVRDVNPGVDGIESPMSLATVPGCFGRGPAQVMCPTGPVTCNGPDAANNIPWIANLPGNGHVCHGGVCDACTADTDCTPNTLPRTCNTTPTSNACSPSAPSHCCTGQPLSAGASPPVGTDSSTCCPSLPRVCRVGVCRDTCTRDADCPLTQFTQSTHQPLFGVCVAGACIPPARLDVEVGDATACNFGDVAVDRVATAPVWLVASVNVRGCTAGQLRLGVSASATPEQVLVLGPESRSDTYTGVDVDFPGQCTGLHRADGSRGVARPSVAVATASTTNGESSGIVAFLGRGQMMLPMCAGTASAEVDALGVYFSPATLTDASFVQATDEGIPVVLGHTVGVGRPAIVPVAGSGWVVGFGAATGTSGVQLRVVADLDPLPALLPICTGPSDCTGGASCIDTTGGDRHCLSPCTSNADCASDALACCLGSSCGARAGFCVASDHGNVARASPPLHPLAATASISGAATSDHVQMSVGAMAGHVADLGVTWQEGCDSEATIVFTHVRLDLSTGALVDAGHRVAIGAGTAPTVAYIDEGVLVPGRATSGGTMADMTNDGGYVVGWTSLDHALVAVRVSEIGDRVVDAAPVRLDDAMRSAPVSTGHFFASSAADARLEFAYAEQNGGALEGGLSCRAIAH